MRRITEVTIALLVLLALQASAECSSITLHFRGRIEGSERISISSERVTWSNVAWGTPEGAVYLSGIRWRPRRNPVLKTSWVLPVAVDFRSARLERIEGRDTIALECSARGIEILLSDTPNGSAVYEFRVHFRPLRGFVVLTVRAKIDGSGEAHITRNAATWNHLHWAWPTEIDLNAVHWNPSIARRLRNSGTTRFLPGRVDFSSAIVIEKSGRDLVSMEARANGLVIRFADNPVGTGVYEIKILLRLTNSTSRSL